MGTVLAINNRVTAQCSVKQWILMCGGKLNIYSHLHHFSRYYIGNIGFCVYWCVPASLQNHIVRVFYFTWQRNALKLTIIYIFPSNHIKIFHGIYIYIYICACYIYIIAVWFKTYSLLTKLVFQRDYNVRIKLTK